MRWKYARRDDLSKVDRERIKQASRELLAGVLEVIAPLDRWTEKEQTQAEVQTFILDRIYQQLPEPPYTAADKQQAAELLYRHIWQQSVGERFAR
jgi:type I restriction enzyme R subunit